MDKATNKRIIDSWVKREQVKPHKKQETLAKRPNVEIIVRHIEKRAGVINPDIQYAVMAAIEDGLKEIESLEAATS